MPDEHGIPAVTEEDRELARLREAFEAGVSGAVPQGDDPDPETIWKAVSGELSPEQTQAVIRRAVESPSCAREWLLARRMSSETQAEFDGGRETHESRPYAAVAVAAGLLIAVTLATWIWSPEPVEPSYRGAPHDLISLVPDGSSLRRDAATLEWEPVPEAREYVLRVLGPDFNVVLMKEGLDHPRFTVPAESLGGIEDGDEIRWQVEVVLPDGTRNLSRLFNATVGSGDID